MLLVPSLFLFPLISAAVIERAPTTSIPLPSATSTWKPILNTTFILDLDNVPIAAPTITTSSGLKLNKLVYHVDMEGSTKAQIDNYHAKGKKVICYLSAGSWEPFRSDHAAFNSSCYCGPGVKTTSAGVCTGSKATQNQLDGWDEWWLDIHSPSCLANVQSVITARIKAAKAKGCDGIDPDNVDAYTNTQKFGITQADEVAYLLWLSKTARANNLLIDLKNAGDLLVNPDTGKATTYQSSLLQAFDFNVIESCHQYNECDKYDSFLAAGKPQVQLEYSNSIKKCPTLKKGQNLLVYSGTDIDSSQITLSC